MDVKITITKKKYEELRRQAAAWRRATGDSQKSVVFNAVRDNGGKGVPVRTFIKILEKLQRADTKSHA